MRWPACALDCATAKGPQDGDQNYLAGLVLVRVVKVLTACELSIRHFLYFVNTKSKEILFIFDEYFINLTTVFSFTFQGFLYLNVFT